MAASATTWPAGVPERPRLHRLAERLGEIDALDGPAGRLADAVKAVVDPGPVKDALSGVPIGHPLHPALTDVVTGAWTWATVLELMGGAGSRPAADRLTAAGVLAAVPTAMTGATDWADTIGPDRRVGVVHAAANVGALSCFAASLVARRSGRPGLVAALRAAGTMTMVAGGLLGGHLSFARGVGVTQTAFTSPPEDWTEAARADDLAEGEPRCVEVAGDPVVLLRRGERIHALADRCNHRGGSLSDGHVHDDCIACPLHHSIFRLADGAVVQGPAVSPQLVYDVRVRDGAVEVRAPAARTS